MIGSLKPSNNFKWARRKADFFFFVKNLEFLNSNLFSSSNLTYELLPVDAFFSLLCRHQVACFG